MTGPERKTIRCFSWTTTGFIKNNLQADRNKKKVNRNTVLSSSKFIMNGKLQTYKRERKFAKL